jgi:hypothetical protein
VFSFRVGRGGQTEAEVCPLLGSAESCRRSELWTAQSEFSARLYLGPTIAGMSPEDRKAVTGIIVGLGGSGLTMAGPLAFPNAPAWVWQFLFFVFGLAVLASLSVLAYDYVIQPKGKRLDPFIAIAICANIVAAVSLAIFAMRSPTSNADPAQTAITRQPELSLLLPKQRYTFKWDTTKGMYFDIQREGDPLPPGHTANPTFVLHNSSPVAAADVVVKWQADISEIKQLAKIGRLAKYDIQFPDNYTLMLVGSPPVPNFQYFPSPTADAKLVFVARDTDLFMPIGIYPILGLFIAAKMPDRLGARTEGFPLRIDVSWNVPDGGQPKSFHVKIRGVNTKPNGPADPPEVIGYLEFEIEKSE